MRRPIYIYHQTRFDNMQWKICEETYPKTCSALLCILPATANKRRPSWHATLCKRTEAHSFKHSRCSWYTWYTYTLQSLPRLLTWMTSRAGNYFYCHIYPTWTLESPWGRNEGFQELMDLTVSRQASAAVPILTVLKVFVNVHLSFVMMYIQGMRFALPDDDPMWYSIHTTILPVALKAEPSINSTWVASNRPWLQILLKKPLSNYKVTQPPKSPSLQHSVLIQQLFDLGTTPSVQIDKLQHMKLTQSLVLPIIPS